MRYMGLDLGTKTLGIAISDKLGIIANSYKILRYDNYDDLLDELENIIKEKEIETLVLGLPKNMNNSVGDSAKRSIDFEKILVKRFRLPIFFQDERMSSVEAHNIMIEGDLSRKKRKKYVDSLAASIILQRFLDSERGK